MNILYIFALLALFACGVNKSSQTSTQIVTVVSEDVEYATYFVVVSDTSTSYESLYHSMFDISKGSGIPVDLMGRSYNKTKDLIALPEDDPDEMYAGEYFPRRFPSESLSLEYLSSYQKAGEKTIALVCGIYEKEKSADSLVKSLKSAEKRIFKIKAKIYVGCMH